MAHQLQGLSESFQRLIDSSQIFSGAIQTALASKQVRGNLSNFYFVWVWLHDYVVAEIDVADIHAWQLSVSQVPRNIYSVVDLKLISSKVLIHRSSRAFTRFILRIPEYYLV